MVSHPMARHVTAATSANGLSSDKEVMEIEGEFCRLSLDPPSRPFAR